MAGAELAPLPYRGRPVNGPPSAPPAVVAGNGAQALRAIVSICYRFSRFSPLLQ